MGHNALLCSTAPQYGDSPLYIIWKERKRVPLFGTPQSPRLIAYAATAWREGGRIRRKTHYLTSFTKDDWWKTSTRQRFWVDAGAALDRLDLEPEVRSRLEERLEERVRRPTEAELAYEEQKIERIREQYRAVCRANPIPFANRRS